MQEDRHVILDSLLVMLVVRNVPITAWYAPIKWNANNAQSVSEYKNYNIMGRKYKPVLKCAEMESNTNKNVMMGIQWMAMDAVVNAKSRNNGLAKEDLL